MRTERVALVHDRLDQDGGAERMLWILHSMFPEAPIYTAMWNPEAVSRFAACDVRVTWMQRLPGIKRYPRAYAALYPLAFAQLDLSAYDLVLSLTTSFAKGVPARAGTRHICYCNTPPNFVWRPRQYFTGAGLRTASLPLRIWLKAWDVHAARQPDIYVASGRPVADRIRAFYSREAVVIPPPLDPGWFTPHLGEEFYLVAGRLVAQKRVELAIQACGLLGAPLWVVGDGREATELRRLAGPTVRFLGRVPDAELRGLYARARALILPAEEDFGLVPLEAQAAGCPVVAYDAGGARETVLDGVTGIRFSAQTAAALAQALQQASEISWDRARIQAHAHTFEESRFRARIQDLVDAMGPLSVREQEAFQ